MILTAPDGDLADLFLTDDAATGRLGQVLARHLRPGDTLLLSGPIGAGKTHLARALIRARFGEGTEVPSPSFTLVQTYGEGEGAVWHADLYRLGHPDELRELGLEEALGSALCVVEWPDRMTTAMPCDALRLSLTPEGEGRRAQLAGGRAGLVGLLAGDWARTGDAG